MDKVIHPDQMYKYLVVLMVVVILEDILPVHLLEVVVAQVMFAPVEML